MQVQSLGQEIPWRKAQQPTPVFLPGESLGQRSLVGYGPQGGTKLDMTKTTQHAHTEVPGIAYGECWHKEGKQGLIDTLNLKHLDPSAFSPASITARQLPTPNSFLQKLNQRAFRVGDIRYNGGWDGEWRLKQGMKTMKVCKQKDET